MNRINRISTTVTTRVRSALERLGPGVLRGSVALVFIWFGALKLGGHSPVAGLVADTVPWLDPTVVVPVLGMVEIVFGLALVSHWPHSLWVPVSMIGYLAGTFTVLIFQPAVAFQRGNPLLLTTTGEFVVKNVVLIAALCLIASQRPTQPTGPLPVA